MTVAYVGSVVPDIDEYRTEAFSPSGNMFQVNLLSGMSEAGAGPSLILSFRPMPAFPRSSRTAIPFEKARLSSGAIVHLVGFINLSVIKQLTIGLSVFWKLLMWGWQQRHEQGRIVYCYNLTVPPGLFTLLAARCIGAKAVASVNDINEPGVTVPSAWPWRLDYWLHRLLLPRFDALVVVSDAIVRDFAPLVRFLRVEGGVTTEMLADSAAVDPSPQPGRFTVVWAGRMKACNGSAVMLDAIARLSGERYRFVFAGDGPMAESVRRAAAKDSRIEYVGHLKICDLLSIYKQADVLINMRLTKALSTRYFFPSKLVELLASGTAVVSTCQEHVEEFEGLFFPVHEETPDGLAKAIRVAEGVGLDARQEMGRRAREYVRAHKTWTSQARKVGDLLSSVAGDPGPGRTRCL